MTALALTDADVDRIARRTAEVLRALPALPPTPAILTRPEARAYTKRHSEAAFCDWCQRWQVRPFARGRYSKTHLDLALDRESRRRAA